MRFVYIDVFARLMDIRVILYEKIMFAQLYPYRTSGRKTLERLHIANTEIVPRIAKNFSEKLLVHDLQLMYEVLWINIWFKDE